MKTQRYSRKAFLNWAASASRTELSVEYGECLAFLERWDHGDRPKQSIWQWIVNIYIVDREEVDFRMDLILEMQDIMRCIACGVPASAAKLHYKAAASCNAKGFEEWIEFITSQYLHIQSWQRPPSS